MVAALPELWIQRGCNGAGDAVSANSDIRVPGLPTPTVTVKLNYC